jgi:hypothetical protein
VSVTQAISRVASVIALSIAFLIQGCVDEKVVYVVASPTPAQTPAVSRSPTVTGDQRTVTALVRVATADARATIVALTPTRTPLPPPYKLAIISAQCNRGEFGYITCEGFVENLTSSILENVEAVVHLP